MTENSRRNRQRFEEADHRPLRDKSREREAERLKRQEEQLKAARKREMLILGGIVGILILSVILIIALTKEPEKEASAAENTGIFNEEETETETEKETVIDIAGKNELPSAATEKEPEETVSETETEPETVTAAEHVIVEPETETPAPVPETPAASVPEWQEYADRAPQPGTTANVSYSILIPSWVTQDFLDISPRNRPGLALSAVHDIVIHWVANPGTTAKGNRDYFNDLAIPEANLEDVSASAHFIVGLDGEVIQCVPVEEMAYANYPRNEDTISIEVCHPDWDGQYSAVTYASVIRLASYLCEQYGLNADHIIRHHDVSGKDCPKYYVLHPEAWLQLKQDVTSYIARHPDIQHEFP